MKLHESNASENKLTRTKRLTNASPPTEEARLVCATIVDKTAYTLLWYDCFHSPNPTPPRPIQPRILPRIETINNTGYQLLIAHFRVLVCLCVKTSLSANLFLCKFVSSERPFSCKYNSFWYERFCTKTRFDTEANQNSEMGYSIPMSGTTSWVSKPQ